MFTIVKDWYQNHGVGSPVSEYLTWSTLVVVVIIGAWLVNLIARRVLLTALSIVIKRTKTDWDDALLERRVLHRAAHIAPALVFYWTASMFGTFEEMITRLATIYMLIVGGLVASAFGGAVIDVYQRLDVSRNRPIKGFVQLAQIIVYVVVGVLAIGLLFDQSPLGLLGGIGAMTAVLLLVFKDTILGLVASFQITTTHIVRVGDWIEFPKYDADGDVIDISLHQIRVQNWNKTISTIPTYALISESFKNWRGMQESGGRRVKRAINIDMSSIRFCDDEMIERFSRFAAIRDYIAARKEELAKHNQGLDVDREFLINGRHLTNVGTFRAYIEAYLKNHPEVHPGLTFLIRQLPPGEHGLPLEIYIFLAEQRWARYESIQADIFDHIIAVIPLFDLRVYQSPSGHDMQMFGASVK